MPLPKIDQPLFELEIPSTGDRVKFRPFTVKEEKILLIAQESNEPEQITTAIKQVLGNCLQNYDIDNLAVFDLEYILLNLRSRSVSNELDIKIKDPDTQEEVEINIDIDNIKIIKADNHNKIVKINEDIFLKMKYPSIDYAARFNENTSQSDMFELMAGCIDSIVEGEQVYKLHEFSQQEVNEFLDSLGAKTMKDMKEFFEGAPKMRYEHKYVNANGVEKTFVAEGTETFFL